MKFFKKLVAAVVSAVMLTSALCVANVAQVAAAEVIPVYLNGTLMQFPANDAQPQIYQNRTYVPIRKTAEYLGLSINWNSKTETLTFSREGLTIDHTMRSNIVYVSGNPLTFDTRSINVQNRTLMPIRMLGESIGATVEWNNEERAVYITTADAQQPTTPTAPATKPELVSASVNNNNVSAGDIVKVTVNAKDATKVVLIDGTTKEEIETIVEYADNEDGSRLFEALIKADNETGDNIIKSIIVCVGDDTKVYDGVQESKTLTYVISADEVKDKDDKDEDEDEDDDDEEIKSDYLVSYKLEENDYEEGDYAVIKVVTTNDIEKVKVTNNYNNQRAESSDYDEDDDERTFEVKTKLSTTGKVKLYICLYVEDEGYEAVTQTVNVKVEGEEEEEYDELEIVDVELLNDTIYVGERAYLTVYTSTDVSEVTVFDDDDKRVARSYYYSGKQDGQLVWNLDFEVDHTDTIKYQVVVYNDDDEEEKETIKIGAENFSKNDPIVLSVEQKSSNISEGDDCKFEVKCTNSIAYIVLATDGGYELARSEGGSKSGSYKKFTIKGEIDDIDDDYYIYGYDEDDSKQSIYKFLIQGKPTEEVEILSVDVDKTRVDFDEEIELVVETTTNVEKLIITDQDDNTVYRKSKPTDETSSKYIWEISFEAEEDGKNTFTITVEDDDDEYDEWDFNVTVDEED